MRASEVMISDVVVAAAGATSSEVAALMRLKNISVVPVVDNPKDRHYLGTISDRDIVSPLPAAMRFALEMMGPDRLLYASDHPWVEPKLIQSCLTSLKLPAAQQDKILGGNARALFRL